MHGWLKTDWLQAGLLKAGGWVLPLAFLFAGPLQAQDAFYLGPQVGYSLLDDDRNLDDAAGLGVQAGVDWNPHWSTELEYYAAEHDLELGNGSVDSDRWSLNGRYRFSDGNWRPFVLVGVAGQQWDLPAVEDNETLIAAGAGVETDLSQRWRLRGDARVWHSHDASFTDAGVLVTLAYVFGGAEPAPTPRPTPKPAPVAQAQPEPEPAPQPSTRPVTVKLNIQFATDSAEIPPRYQQELARVASIMQEHRDVTTVIEGHTDALGAAEYNQQLSERRATAVLNALVTDFGIDPARLKAVGYGETRPVASNDTAAGRAENRRIEAVFTYQKTVQP